MVIDRAHLSFFKSKDRKEKFKELFKEEDTDSKIRINMLAILCGCKPVLEIIIMSLFQKLNEELQASQGNLILEHLPGRLGSEIQKFKLDSFFWGQVGKNYNYNPDHPSLLDFLLELMRFSIEPLMDKPSIFLLKQEHSSTIGKIVTNIEMSMTAFQKL